MFQFLVRDFKTDQSLLKIVKQIAENNIAETSDRIFAFKQFEQRCSVFCVRALRKFC